MRGAHSPDNYRRVGRFHLPTRWRRSRAWRTRIKRRGPTATQNKPTIPPAQTSASINKSESTTDVECRARAHRRECRARPLNQTRENAPSPRASLLGFWTARSRRQAKKMSRVFSFPLRLRNIGNSSRRHNCVLIILITKLSLLWVTEA